MKHECEAVLLFFNSKLERKIETVSDVICINSLHSKLWTFLSIHRAFISADLKDILAAEVGYDLILYSFARALISSSRHIKAIIKCEKVWASKWSLWVLGRGEFTPVKLEWIESDTERLSYDLQAPIVEIKWIILTSWMTSLLLTDSVSKILNKALTRSALLVGWVILSNWK